jgi:hypothetical protein
MAPFNLFDCERSTNVRVNVVYFTEYLTLLCTSSRHATFPSVSGRLGCTKRLGFWGPYSRRPTEDAPNTFLFFYIANHSCRAGASPFSSLLRAAAQYRVLLQAAAPRQRSQRQRHRSSSPPDREGRRLWRRRERHEGQWPRRRREAALRGAGRGGYGGDPAGVQEDGAEPQGDPRRPLGGRDLHHAPRLQHGPRRRRREAYLPRYTLEPSLRRPFTPRVPTVLARISWPGARHPTLGFE